MIACVQTDTTDTTDVHVMAKKSIDHGVTFANASALLAPYQRADSGEGLGGVAWLDYDNDGDLDLLLTNGVFNVNGLFRNDDGAFTDVTLASGLIVGSGSSGVVVGDLDNDGDSDVFLTGEGHLVGPQQTPAQLFANNGDGTFTNKTATAGIAANDSALGAAMGDVNGDGLLDIFIASPGHIPFLTGPGTGESHPNKLYINNGNLTFTDVAAAAGVTGEYVYPLPGIGVVTDGACVASFIDYDMDDKLDILVGNCNAYPYTPFPMPVRPTPFNLYRNNGDGTFTDMRDAAGLNVLGFWMGLALGDIDNDGDTDFFATSTGTFADGQFPHVLMRNNGDGTFTNVATDAGLQEFGWGATMADFDNDGDLDLYQVGALPLFGAIGPGLGSPGRLYFNDGAGTFTDSTASTGVNLSFDYTSGVAQGDYDGDGFADLVVMTAPWSAGGASNPNGAPVLLRNEGNNNNAITVRLVAADNSSVVGARVRLKLGGDRQYRTIRAGTSMASSESPWPSFGIGHKKKAKLVVTWPSGCIEKFKNVRRGALRTLVEGTGKSKCGCHHAHDHSDDDDDDGDDD